MAGYLLGGFLIGLLVGISVTIGAMVFYYKKLKKKVDEVKLKFELNAIDNKKGK